MVTFGSPFAGSTFTRVSSVLSRNVILSNLTRNQRELSLIQEQLSSGYRINRPSDDPVGAVRVLDTSARIQRNTQFTRNIDRTTGRLTLADAALGRAGEIINRARDIMLQQAQTTQDASSRLQAAEAVSQLLKEAVAIGNQRYENRALFGGSRTGEDPFVITDGNVVFQGDLKELYTETSEDRLMETHLSASAFGALTDELIGRDPTTLFPINLNPDVDADTALSNLHQGRGIELGSILIEGPLNPGAPVTLDLSSAESLGDVIDLIDSVTATTGVDADLNAAANGLVLTGGPLTVSDLTNGRTASDLGIAGTAPVSIVGADLDPRMTLRTELADLVGGTFTSSGGLTITNTAPGQTYTATIPASAFAAGNTVEQMVNAINSSDAYVTAQISDDGQRIELLSRLSGGRLRVAENGGTTAAELGLLSTLSRSRLVDLNGGVGVGSDPGADVRIVKKNGGELLIDVDNMDTVQDLLDQINSDPDLTATINGLDQIEITDASIGAATFAVRNVGPGLTATQLGIEGSAAVTLTGTTLTAAGEQPEGIFTALIRLRDGLIANSDDSILGAGRLLNLSQDKLNEGRSEAGSRLLTLEFTRDRLDLENTEMAKFRSETRDVDLAEAATRFTIQQTVLEAALATAARILDTNLLKYLP